MAWVVGHGLGLGYQRHVGCLCALVWQVWRLLGAPACDVLCCLGQLNWVLWMVVASTSSGLQGTLLWYDMGLAVSVGIYAHKMSVLQEGGDAWGSVLGLAIPGF